MFLSEPAVRRPQWKQVMLDTRAQGPRLKLCGSQLTALNFIFPISEMGSLPTQVVWDSSEASRPRRMALPRT